MFKFLVRPLAVVVLAAGIALPVGNWRKSHPIPMPGPIIGAAIATGPAAEGPPARDCSAGAIEESIERHKTRVQKGDRA